MSHADAQDFWSDKYRAVGDAERALSCTEQTGLCSEEAVRRGAEQIGLADGAVLVGPEVLRVGVAHQS
jgi:hypothetical protein